MSNLIYTNPGTAFINRTGIPKRPKDLGRFVEDYASFLLEVAQARSVPVDLEKICRHFGIKWSSGNLPKGTDGVSDGHVGNILINEDHAEVRQRFTHCHELVEMLFAALIESAVPEEVWHFLDGPHKEHLCNRGGAAVLLPFGLFEEEIRTTGISIDAGRELANRFRASRIATLLALSERGPGLHALIGWRQKLKPKQIRATGNGMQLDLGPGFNATPDPLMRVEWVRTTRDAKVPFIPKDKSIGKDSIISRCVLGHCDPRDEELELGQLHGCCLVEALFIGDENTDVVSLIHLPGDGCDQTSGTRAQKRPRDSEYSGGFRDAGSSTKTTR